MSRTWLRRSAPLAAVAAVSLVLAACSTGGDTTDPTASGSASASSTEEATTPEIDLASTGWTRAERDAIADGGTLNLAIDSYPANFNLNNVDAGTVDDQTIANLFVPGFVTIGEDGSWSANKLYADSVELVSEDPQVVEVKIAEAAVWSDGTPITVKDVAANWGALNGTNEAFAPNATNVWEDIASVEQGATEKDVKITFAKVNADWVSILGSIYPAWLMETPEAFNTAWVNGPYAADGTTFVSGGPFIVTAADASGQVLTFGPNPAWWGETPKLESVIFKVISRNGLAQAFGNSEIDATNLYGSADNLATAEGRSDAVIQRSLGTTFRHITLNGTSDTFSDPKVREAFAMSLNRPVLAQAILGGVGSPAIELNNLIFMPGQNGYEDNASQYYGNDVEAAKTLLEEAGVTVPVPVRFVIPSENTNSANIAQLVQQQTAGAFEVTIETVPSADFFVSYVTTPGQNFDATYFAWQGTAFPISSTQSIYYPADSGQNFPGVTNEDLGPLWEEANAELDVDARLKLADGIDQKLVELFTTLPLFPEPYAWGVRKDLVNYGPVQFETIAWENVGFAS